MGQTLEFQNFCGCKIVSKERAKIIYTQAYKLPVAVWLHIDNFTPRSKSTVQIKPYVIQPPY